MKDEPECPECGGRLVGVSVLGGDVCGECQIFFSPYGFDENWEVK